MQTVCPECGGIVPFPEDSLRGEFVTCPDCGVGLELTKVDPLTVEVALLDGEEFGE